MKREGSLHGRGDTCQCILALLVVLLSIDSYLIVLLLLLIIIITIDLIPSLPCTYSLLLLFPLILLRFPLPLGLGAVRRPHGWIPRQWSQVIHEDEVPRLVPSLSKLVSQGQEIN